MLQEVRASVAVWVRFGFQVDSLKKSDPLNAGNCVGVLKISFVYVDRQQPLRRSVTYSGVLLKHTPPFLQCLTVKF